MAKDEAVKRLTGAPVIELRGAIAGAIADARALRKKPTIARKRGEMGVYAARAVYLEWLDEALPALLKLAVTEDERRSQLLTLARLASPEPMFSSPIAVWEAQRLRDEVLREAGLIAQREVY